MNLIDTHSHIYSEEFDNDIDEVILRAKENGVSKILLPNIDLDSAPRMFKLVDKYPNVCFPMMGLHPCYIDAGFEDKLASIKAYFEEHKFCAVGEIGIDLYWDKTFIEEQKKAFAIQVQWSIDMDLPVVIHVRDAFDEVFEVLGTFPCEKFVGVFHSFTGDLNQAKKALSMGFFLGINGILTFKNSPLADVVAQLPLDRLLLETDSPYLSPMPKRGRRNESCNVLYIAQKIALLHNVDLEVVVAKTSLNAQELFKV